MDWLLFHRTASGLILALPLLLVLFTRIDALRMMELQIPRHVVRGDSVRLVCNYSLDGTALQSVKWYKDGNEFYRYVPKEKPAAVTVFALPGVSVDKDNSSESSVALSSVNLMSTGLYRCEVSGEAPAFQTVSDHADMDVVALPEEGPIIDGRPNRHRYQVSDVVRFNCTSRRSKPAASLTWFINGEPVSKEMLRGPEQRTEIDTSDGLETITLGLEFRIREKHFKRGDMKIKCLASIHSVYLKTNELSIEAYRPENKVSVLESKETRPEGHTRAEQILGGSSQTHVALSSLIAVGLALLL